MSVCGVGRSIGLLVLACVAVQAHGESRWPPDQHVELGNDDIYMWVMPARTPPSPPTSP